MAKPNYEFEFHPEAILEIREAIEWYRERDEAVATEFGKTDDNDLAASPS